MPQSMRHIQSGKDLFTWKKTFFPRSVMPHLRNPFITLSAIKKSEPKVHFNKFHAKIIRMEDESAQITAEEMALLLCPQFSDGFVLNLANSFSCKIEFFTDVFEAQRMIYAESKEIANNFFLAFCQ